MIYLYCLLAGEAAPALDGIPAIEEAPLRALRTGDLQAIVSDVGEQFAETSLNERVRDLDWLSPRAVRHHEVIDRLYQQHLTLLPLTFGAIFASEDSLQQQLNAQRADLGRRLEELLGKEEWDLRLTRDEKEFRARLRSHSRALTAMEGEAAGKAPGTRFLMEKKIHNLEAREAQRLGAEVRDEVYGALSVHALSAHRERLVAPAGEPAVRLELRAAYLVEEAGGVGLKSAVGDLSRKYGPLGYRFELTGPWPAFSFAGGVREALA